jgi:hypothetical protein
MARLFASLLLVVYWTFLTAGSESALDVPGVWTWIPSSPALALVVVVGPAVVVGLYVARWWLMSATLTPIIVLGILELAGQSPWERPGPPLTQYLWWPLGWDLIWFFILPLGLGIAVRRGLGERGARVQPWEASGVVR